MNGSSLTLESSATDQQHDDHCRIVCGGIEWWIVAIEPNVCLWLTSEWGQTAVDITELDYDLYTMRAIELLDKHFKGGTV